MYGVWMSGAWLRYGGWLGDPKTDYKELFRTESLAEAQAMAEDAMGLTAAVDKDGGPLFNDGNGNYTVTKQQWISAGITVWP